ncbi:probable E3 ubiquitin-protein ligase HERC4 [Saccostrea echinata]|uniref:probable E3 ubiquitin-protein ligase HERC4 n=1 Tax=Saccostrea echinata TaxID=191078 RepID=UPI002A829AE0|nr:probable E3 ubiquitin-protein ligase HERC4 [Saccostrea echinata]
MTGVFGWGSSHDGQLSIGATDEGNVLSPKEIPSLQKLEIKEIACGEKHTLIVTKGGELYSCGSNEHGELGHSKPRSKAELVTSLSSMHVTQAKAGSGYSVVITTAGEVFSWGRNDTGQLGRGKLSNEEQRKPKLIKTLAVYTVVQISCGSSHCLALTDDGRLFSWGCNKYGQLGLGTSNSHDTPQQIISLKGIPVALVAVGGNHSFILSCSGAVFGWGKNSFGQLGLNDELDKYHPTLCKSLRNQKVKYMSCGEDHTVALTKDGGVFTFGAGGFGQLGHSSMQNEILPKRVMELMGSVITQVICGRRHTIVFSPSSGKMYAFGLGGAGQLGLGDTVSRNSPFPILSPYLPSLGRRASQVMDHDGTLYTVKHLFSNGDHCFLLANTAERGGEPDDFRIPDPSTQITTLTAEKCDEIRKLQPDVITPSELVDDVLKIFSSSACLNASFLLKNDDHYGCSSKNCGLDMDEVRRLMNRIADAKNVNITQQITESIENNLLRSLPPSPPDVEALRIYLILPEFHLFDEPKFFSTLIGPFGKCIVNLERAPARILDLWWGSLKPRFFKRILEIYRNTALWILRLPNLNASSHMEMVIRLECLKSSLGVLKKLNSVNDANGQIIPYDNFYISEVAEKIDIRKDYVNWVHRGKILPSPQIHFCDYPFIFDASAKSVLLQTDACMQMQSAYEEVQRRNFQNLFLPIDPINPMLVLHVTRHNIVTDTLHQLSRQGPADLKKPLKVIFLGEEAVDEGGVRKEFFLLLMKEILDPKYGMFKFFEESRLQWFNPTSFEDKQMFHLIGAVCGLAIYNSTIIGLSFPLALYKKLLNRKTTLDDLMELMPSVGRGMHDLLDYEEDDVEDVFCLTFEITVESFGEVQHIPLVEGGSEKSVTKDNRQEYIDAYVDYVFNKSVEDHFREFSNGFHKVCGGKVLELFHPQELQAMVIGNENYDFHEFEVNAEYKGEYYRQHPTIQLFWNVFHELPIQLKKKFLLFLTGSDRIPILGMKAVKMIIQPTHGGNDYLPVAHTCFNLLDLPKYQDYQTMKEKLRLAIEQTEGFGIV